MAYDFSALAEGIGQGSNILQQYLWDKYMRGQEMSQWKQKQDYIKGHEIKREERADTRWYEHLDKSAELEEEIAVRREKRQAELALFDMNPEYQEFVKRGTSPEATLGDRLKLLGIQGLRSKQSQFEPLGEKETQFLGSLPVSMQNHFPFA